MRALVTGCAGFVGSHLTEDLLDDGNAVLGIDCFNDNYGRAEKLQNLERAQDWDTFDFVPIDLARGDLNDLVEECDLVFHLAAEPGVRPSWGRRFEQYLRNNVLATQHLLEAVRHVPDKRLVFASSSSIYGQAECFPTPEAATPRPFSPYGVTKLSAESLCSLYHMNHGLSTVSLRFFTVYGPRQRPDMAFDIFMRAALANQSIKVFGDGTQTRDFTYVADVVSALRLASTQREIEGDIFNIGGGSRVTVNEVLDLVSDLVPHDLQVSYTESRSGDVAHTCADTRHARARLGFAPTILLSQGVQDQFEWVRQSSQGSRPR